MTAPLLPPAEIAAVIFLRTHPDLAAIHGGRVGTRLNPVLPALRLNRIGNAPPELWEDDAHLQVECWAADQATADLLARTLVAAWPDVRGYPIGSAGRIHTYAITSGPYWAPDDPEASDNARYIVTVSLLITT